MGAKEIPRARVQLDRDAAFVKHLQVGVGGLVTGHMECLRPSRVDSYEWVRGILGDSPGVPCKWGLRTTKPVTAITATSVIRRDPKRSSSVSCGAIVALGGEDGGAEPHGDDDKRPTDTGRSAAQQKNQTRACSQESEARCDAARAAHRTCVSSMGHGPIVPVTACIGHGDTAPSGADWWAQSPGCQSGASPPVGAPGDC
jgi:hypothetical protein